MSEKRLRQSRFPTIFPTSFIALESAKTKINRKEIYHKDVVRVGQFAAGAEKLHEVVELPMDVTADGHRRGDRLHVGLLEQKLLHLRNIVRRKRVGEKEKIKWKTRGRCKGGNAATPAALHERAYVFAELLEVGLGEVLALASLLQPAVHLGYARTVHRTLPHAHALESTSTVPWTGKSRACSCVA